MALATNGGSGTAANYLQRAPSPSGLADVLDVILDKGLVIDAFVRVSVVGIEVLTIDARIVVASVDTYLRFAEAVNRLDLKETQYAGLPELREDIAKGVTQHKIENAEEKIPGVGEGESSRLSGAAKGVAAGAAVAGAAAAAEKLADRRDQRSQAEEDGEGK